jgi:hypothetical protein
LKSALSELEKEPAVEKVGGNIEGVKKVERSVIPRRHVSVSSFAT